MKKILVALSHYGSSNRNHFLECINEYNNFKNYDVYIHAYLTEEIDFSNFTNIEVTQHIYDSSIGYMLTHEYKNTFLENKDSYDYFIYCEDDVKIMESNIIEYEKIQSTLPIPFVCGFLRYEKKLNENYKYLFDNHPIHSCHRNGKTVIKSNYIINEEKYFEPYNVHQGCHVLTKEHLKFILNNKGQYFEKYSVYAGIREAAASDVYVVNGLIKVIPRNVVEKLLIHHLPNKYVKMLPDIYNNNDTPDDVKIKNMENESYEQIY